MSVARHRSVLLIIWPARSSANVICSSGKEEVDLPPPLPRSDPIPSTVSFPSSDLGLNPACLTVCSQSKFRVGGLSVSLLHRGQPFCQVLGDRIDAEAQALRAETRCSGRVAGFTVSWLLLKSL